MGARGTYLDSLLACDSKPITYSLWAFKTGTPHMAQTGLQGPQKACNVWFFKSCVCVSKHGGSVGIVFILVYVDDILLLSTSSQEREDILKWSVMLDAVILGSGSWELRSSGIRTLKVSWSQLGFVRLFTLQTCSWTSEWIIVARLQLLCYRHFELVWRMMRIN